MALRVRRLEVADDRSGFRSGNLDLDRFFVRYAGQNQFRHHIGTTYIAVDDSGAIAGFATVTASELATSSPLPGARKRPRYPVPVLRLARLAVDARAQGRVGTVLLGTVLALARTMAVDIGCAGVVVDAKPEAIAFYERLGFMRLDTDAGRLADRPEPVPMFIEIGRIPR